MRSNNDCESIPPAVVQMRQITAGKDSSDQAGPSSGMVLQVVATEHTPHPVWRGNHGTGQSTVGGGAVWRGS